LQHFSHRILNHHGHLCNSGLYNARAVTGDIHQAKNS
jgi:hypothetical protein